MSDSTSGTRQVIKKRVYLLFMVFVLGFFIWQTWVFPNDLTEQTFILGKDPVYTSHAIQVFYGMRSSIDEDRHFLLYSARLERENYWAFDRDRFLQEVHKGDTVTVLRSQKVGSPSYGEVISICKKGHNYGNLFWRNVLAPWGFYLFLGYMMLCVALGVFVQHLNQKNILHQEYTFSLGNREYIISHLPSQAVAFMMLVGILAYFVWWMIEFKARS